MNQFRTIAKKEFVRFFTDRRLWITALILPGLLIYLLYSLMGGLLQNTVDKQQEYTYKVYVFYCPESDSDDPYAFFSSLTAEYNVEFLSAESEESAKQAVKDKSADLVVIFPEDFLEKIAEYNVASGDDAPNVRIFYNSSRTESATGFGIFQSYLNAVESALANLFDINGGDGTFDLATQKDTTGQIFSQLFPMIMLMLLFSGCMSVVPDSFAGEKERGTLATVLVTPVKRRSIVLGKVFSLACISALSGISGFLGTVGALPQLMKAASGSVDASVYGAGEIASLLFVILSVTVLFVTMMSVVSAFAKNTKEASAFLSPLMILVMLCCIPAAVGDAPNGIWTAFVPIFNAVVAMDAIFSFTAQPATIVATVCVNFVCAALLVWLLSAMFRSEKVMFNG